MSRPLSLDDLGRIAVPSQPALSADRLVYVVRRHDLDADTTPTALWIAEGDAPARPLTAGPDDRLPAWSPDGTTLAFVRDTQLWLLTPDARGGAEPTRLTDLPLGAGAPHWSPDGRRIAFSAPVDAAPQARPNAPIVADGLDYQSDGRGYVGSVRMQILVVEAATGAVRAITAGRHDAFAPAWSPDGRALAYLAKPQDGGLAPEAAVHLIDLSPAGPLAAPRVVAFAGGYASSVCFTPDGSRLVVTGHRGGVRGHGRLHIVDPASGGIVELAGDLDRNVMPGAPGYPGAAPAVTADGTTVLFCVRDHGCTHLYSVPLAGGIATALVTDADTVVCGLSLAESTAAVAVTTASSFGEVITVDLATGKCTPRTDHGAELGEMRLAPRTARSFTISDGTAVEAWLLRSESTAGPGPLLLDVHGGPHNAWNGAADEVHLYHQELVAAGWTVLLVNPRGSDGYGEAFFDAVFGGWGINDAADLLEPIEALVAEGLADPARLAVTGYSYGGFMTGYLTSRDDRFAAAVAGGMVSDLTSLSGTSDISHLLTTDELGMTPWEHAAELAAMSPLTRVDRVATPTLVLHGAEDRTCPAGQAQQWHYALRRRGVASRLVLYPGGGHLFLLDGPPSHRIDYGRRLLGWLEEHAS